MKKTLLFTLLTLFGMTQLAAQEYEYVPFVREGVKWVYYYDENPLVHNVQYYSFEMKGDTVFNGKHYKSVVLYLLDGVGGTEIAQDFTPVYLREENKVVYAIHPDGISYRQCPVGITGSVSAGFTGLVSNEEFVLYDFNDPNAFYSDLLAAPEGYRPYMTFCKEDSVAIDGKLSKRYLYNGFFDTNDLVIEGIGCDCYYGMPLFYFPTFITGVQDVFGLSHVIKDGRIIYKGMYYQEPEPEPSDYEYVPFVREGVKWVYCYENPFGRGVLDMPEGIQYYSFEMKGDVQIGDKLYKPVILTHYLDENGMEKEVEDFVPVYLREEDKVVYAKHADGIQHPQCPVGIYQFISYPYQGLPIYVCDEEFVLYDFNDPKAFYDTIFAKQNMELEDAGLGPFIDYVRTDMIPLGNRQSKCHYFNYIYSDVNKIIEGIGYDGKAGMPLFYFKNFITGFEVMYYLSHVIENGEIIYKGIHYNPDVHVGIDEVVSEQSRREWDGNYYNLMGQPVGTEVPTTPGIYIHQGKKICVR